LTRANRRHGGVDAHSVAGGPALPWRRREKGLDVVDLAELHQADRQPGSRTLPEVLIFALFIRNLISGLFCFLFCNAMFFEVLRQCLIYKLIGIPPFFES